jgi:hypothetical protein
MDAPGTSEISLFESFRLDHADEKSEERYTAAPRNRGRPAARKAARAVSTLRPGEVGSSRGMLLGYARVSTIDQNLA